MAGRFDPRLLRVLDAIHRTASTESNRSTWRAAGWPETTAKRWHRAHRLTYYPNVTYESLGLVHEHLIIESPSADQCPLPFVADATWIVDNNGAPALYLHCLRPDDEYHERLFAKLASPSCVRITTRDAWQENRGLAESIDANGRVARLRERHARQPTSVVPATTLIQEYPLLVPVSCEVWGARRTNEEIWQAIYARLGERVWSYLPRRFRRSRHKGKSYVRHALSLLSRAGLVREHIIRYEALHEQLTEIIAITSDLDAVARHAVLIEIYPAASAYLVRALGDVHLIKAAWRAHKRGWWLIDDRPAEARGIAYERFDPRTGAWRRS